MLWSSSTSRIVPRAASGPRGLRPPVSPRESPGGGLETSSAEKRARDHSIETWGFIRFPPFKVASPEIPPPCADPGNRPRYFGDEPFSASSEPLVTHLTIQDPRERSVLAGQIPPRWDPRGPRNGSEQNGLQDLLERLPQRHVAQDGGEGGDEADGQHGDERVAPHRQRAHAVDRAVAGSQIGKRRDRRIAERLTACAPQPAIGEQLGCDGWRAGRSRADRAVCRGAACARRARAAPASSRS